MTNTRKEHPTDATNLLARAMGAIAAYMRGDIDESAFAPLLAEYDALPHDAAPSGDAVAVPPTNCAPLPWRMVPWHIEEGEAAVRDANGDIVCCTASDDTAKFIAACANRYAAPVPAPPSGELVTDAESIEREEIASWYEMGIRAMRRQGSRIANERQMRRVVYFLRQANEAAERHRPQGVATVYVESSGLDAVLNHGACLLSAYSPSNAVIMSMPLTALYESAAVAPPNVADAASDKQRLDWLDTQRTDVVGHDHEGGPELLAHAWSIQGQTETVRELIDALAAARAPSEGKGGV